MKTRVITSIVGLALLVLASTFFYTIYFNLIFAALALIAVHEIFAAFGFGKKEAYIYVSFIPVTLVIMLSDYSFATWLVRPMAYIFVVFIAICSVVNIDKIEFSKIGSMALFSGIVVFCFYSMIYLKSILPYESNSYDALYFIILMLSYAWGGDTFAYFAGSAFGKHKLAPKVSPKKTIEGAVGGLIGSMAFGLLITVLYVNVFDGFIVPLSGKVSGGYYIAVALLGIPASILGILGDLFASTIKRQCKIKDYGKIFPGHGGILDRFDSLLFIAPFVVLVVRMVFYRFFI